VLHVASADLQYRFLLLDLIFVLRLIRCSKPVNPCFLIMFLGLTTLHK
jgi:hypothetical protein